MSRNTREHPHRTLLSPDEVTRLERYHAGRRSYPLGGPRPRYRSMTAANPLEALVGVLQRASRTRYRVSAT